MTTLLIIGIIYHEPKIWTYLIKKKLKIITNDPVGIKNSSLYTILEKLESFYGILSSYKDDNIQRRFYTITDHGTAEYKKMKKKWFELHKLSENYLENLDNHYKGEK